MRAFIKWFALAICLFGVSAGGYHVYLESHPKKVLVILDSSFPMAVVWDRVPEVLASIEVHRYTIFALASDKGLIHGWQSVLDLGRTVPYAPRNLKDLHQQLHLPEVGEASATYLVTNAAADEIPASTGWKIVHLR